MPYGARSAPLPAMSSLQSATHLKGGAGLSVLLDEAHGQHRWVGRPTVTIGYERALEAIRAFARVASSLRDELTREVLDAHGVLVLSVTFERDLTSGECSAIAVWIEEGHGLLVPGTYLFERHHETNLNSLLRRLGVRLFPDLFMPVRKDDDTSCQRQAIGVDRELAVTADLRAAPEGHPILDGVRHVAFQSPCTVEAEGRPELVAEHGAACSKMKAIGHSEDEADRLILIEEYRIVSRSHLPFLFTSRAGLGRVVAIGPWKIFLSEFAADGHADNCKPSRNCSL